MMNFSEYLTLSYLHKLLKSSNVGVGILAISFLFIFSMNLLTLVFILITLIAIPFSFYMLIVLYMYDKTGWIYGFLIFIGISFLPLLFLSNENLFFIAFKFAPLLAFVLYNMILKVKVGEWLMEKDFDRDIENSLNRK